MTDPLIIGHRGASADAPENTLLAFERALADGADGLEFDVRLARDGVPVVIHDADLRRTGLREGEVARMSSAELGSVEVGTWFNRRFPTRARAEYAEARIPTLEAVLRDLGPRCASLYVELKCAAGEARAHAEAAVAAIRAQGRPVSRRVVVESFTLDAVKEVKRLAPELRAAALFERRLSHPLPPRRSMIAAALDCGADELALQRTLATRRAVEAAREAGLGVVVWTVDHAAWVARARSLGLRALITNRPGRLRAALDAPPARLT